MKINKYGFVLALKNLGIWLAQFTIAEVRADSPAFVYALIIYACVSIPSDLLLLNHATSEEKK